MFPTFSNHASIVDRKSQEQLTKVDLYHGEADNNSFHNAIDRLFALFFLIAIVDSSVFSLGQFLPEYCRISLKQADTVQMHRSITRWNLVITHQVCGRYEPLRSAPVHVLSNDL